MSLYRYRAKDRKGHKYKGIREGENEAQLVKSLAEDGLYCYFLQNEDRVVFHETLYSPIKMAAAFFAARSVLCYLQVFHSQIF